VGEEAFHPVAAASPFGRRLLRAPRRHRHRHPLPATARLTERSDGIFLRKTSVGFPTGISAYGSYLEDYFSHRVETLAGIFERYARKVLRFRH
jgi:hypothetical protein